MTQARRSLETARAAAGSGPERPKLDYPAPARVAVAVGAGTMGAGIAQALVRKGLVTQLLDRDPSHLTRTVERIRISFDGAVQRGRLSEVEAAHRLDLLCPGTDWATPCDADLAIEVLSEEPWLRQDILAKLHDASPPHARFARNTSTLDIDVLASGAGRLRQVLGLRFLKSAHAVPLVEVVHGTVADARTLAAAAALARRIGKLPVQTGNAWGFIGNRLFEGHLREADALVLRGVSPARVDDALEAFGMAMGPCRTVAMAGLDIAAQVIAERDSHLPGAWPAAHRLVTRRLAALGRLGVTSGRGHYLHDDRTPLPDEDHARIVAQAAHEVDISPVGDIDDAEIVRRCIALLVAEGQRVLTEGVAHRASDIDLVCVVGYGFPADRGAPLFFAGQRLYA